MSPLKDDWAAVAEDADYPPFLAFGWLEAWARVYRPRRLVGVRVLARDDQVIGVGVAEVLPFGRIRFAGGRISSVRSPLFRRGDELRAWDALRELVDRRGDRLTCVEAAGVDSVSGLPRSVVTPIPWYRMALPDSFAAYMDQRPSELRRNLRRKLRLAEREEAVVVTTPAHEMAAALDRFVALHRLRAESKRERHPTIDDRLVQVLKLASANQAVDLWITEVKQADRTIAVSLQLDNQGTSWFYNLGFDPSAARLSPGIVARLGSIEQAIERGAKHCDFGPGEGRHKLDLGGQRHDRVKLEAASRSAIGNAQRLRSLSVRRARESEWIRSRFVASRWWLSPERRSGRSVR